MQINYITNYAIKALMFLATVDRPASTREIAVAIQVSRNLLANILIKLRANGYVHAERGAEGGYSLEREPESISLLDIIKCMEKTVYINHCLEPNTKSHMRDDPNYDHIRDYFADLQTHLEKSLDSMTLDKLIHPDKRWIYADEVR